MHGLASLSSLGVKRMIMRLGFGLERGKKNGKVEALLFFWSKECQKIEK
jgi:hypothetical protein